MQSQKINLWTILQCTKCGKTQPDPIVLKCCHTICKQCLEKDLKTQIPSQRACPVCQKDEPISGDTDDLHNNLQTCITTVSKVLDTRAFGEVTACCICRLLNVDIQATHQCLDCGDTLCESCQKGHQSSSATHAHRVVDIDGIQKGKYFVNVKKTFSCHQHSSKKYEFYCDTCTIPLCAVCLIFQHLDHQVISLDEAAGKCRSKLQDLSNKMDEKLNGSVTLSRDILSRHKKTIEKTEETTVSAVREKTRSLIDLIRKQEQDIVDQITKLSEHQRSDLDLKENKLIQVIETGVLSMALAKGVLDDGSDEEVIMLFGSMKKCLDSQHTSMSEEHHAKLVSNLKTPVYTVEYNFPEVQSRMYTLQETYLPYSARSDMKSVPRTASGNKRPGKKKENVTEVSPKQTPVKHQSLKASTTTEGTKQGTSLRTFSDDDGQTTTYQHEENIIKVTESLSIVGGFGRSLSLNELTPSDDTSVGERSIQGESVKSAESSVVFNEVLQDVIPGPLDCKLHPPNTLLARGSVGGNLNRGKSKSQTNLPTGTYSLPKQEKQKTFCFAKHISIPIRVLKDTVDPAIVGLCRSGDNRFVLLDDGNKKVRLVHSVQSSRCYSVNHPNILKEPLSPHGVAMCGKSTVIADGILKLKHTFKLDIPASTEVRTALPLSKYTDTSFLIGNLPGNKYRVYSISGDLLEEKQCPVEGPIAAITCHKYGHLLYSSWNQPGAVFQIRNTNKKVKTYRPPSVDLWYPEGTCVDMENNVYIASPRQNQIYVFRSNGSQLYVHSGASVSAPRCLVMMSNNTLIVSGDGPDLQTYKCTHCVKASD